MLILGAIIGFVLSFVFIAAPIAVAMAAHMGLILTIPAIGIPLAPLPVNITGFMAVSIYFFVSLISYVVASVAVATSGAVPATGAVARTPAGGSPAGWEFVESFTRGAMIGTTAVFNWAVLPILPAWMFSWFPPLSAVLVLAIPILWQASTVMMVFNLLCLDEGLCGNPVFEAILGYLTWIMPSAVLANLIGLVILVINGISAAFGFFFRIQFEWWIGALVVHGGVIKALPPFAPTAFTVGNFIFVDGVFSKTLPIDLAGSATKSLWTADGLVFHESGHTMNAGAFGSWWHLVGAIDEAIQGTAAYAELLAESHMHASAAPWFPLWGSPVLGATIANTPATAATATFNGVDIVPGVARQVYSAGVPVTLATTGTGDPDGFPLALGDPGVNPAFTFLWAVTPLGPGTQTFGLPAPTAAGGTMLFDTGGDYSARFRTSDGLEGVFASASISVVEARANGPYTGTGPATGASNPVALSAAGSTAGTRGVLPSVATGGGPVLTLAWAVTGVSQFGMIGSIDNPSSETPNFTGNQPGAYFVSLTVTEPGGVSHTDSSTVTIAVV